ncbi:MAG: ABC transporter substrate-binding protein [Coxiellaceae bacterium]|jgi:phospholipid transport system substrate-binding protein|nr:ABC transporter substrate-binding protein [Coxiellaceae bacterium]
MGVRKIIIGFLNLLIGVAFFTVTAAQAVVVSVDPEPLAMLKNISKQMLAELDKYRKRGNLKNNPKLVNSLVKRIIVPHFNLVRMSQAVVGGNYWRPASSTTQQRFVNEFTQYVIRTYSSAMQSYDGETVKFYPIRGRVEGSIRISSDLLLKSSPPIQLQYGLSWQDSGWLIYDFSVDGVSIVKNYNSQFAGILRQKGLDGLVQELHKCNVDR